MGEILALCLLAYVLGAGSWALFCHLCEVKLTKEEQIQFDKLWAFGVDSRKQKEKDNARQQQNQRQKRRT